MPLPRTPGSVDSGARNAPHLRVLNRDRILTAAMDRAEPFTRSELIQATGLSAPTVGELSTELLRAGLLRDLGTGPSRGGRRPSFMEFDARSGFVLGIGLGATRTHLAVADMRNERLAHREMPTPSTAGPGRMLSQLAGWARSLLEDVGVSRDKLLAIGVGIPGRVDYARGVVIDRTPNLKGWSSVSIGDTLSRTLGAPVLVENDVNMAVLGEHWKGVAQGHDTCVFIHVGTGIGAGVLIDGRLHRGHNFLAGEIGLSCLGPQFVEQDFGTRGCLETLAGMSAVLSHARGNWSDAGELLSAAAKQDAAAVRALKDAATLIGIATANLSLAIDPSMVVLGGALAAHQKFVAEIRRVVERVIVQSPQIVVSGLEREATLWGSLLVAARAARTLLRQRLSGDRALGS